MSDAASVASAARAKHFLDLITQHTGPTLTEPAALCFDALALRDVTAARSDGPGHCACELLVTARVSNTHGTLHGGCTGKQPYLTTPCSCLAVLPFCL